MSLKSRLTILRNLSLPKLILYNSAVEGNPLKRMINLKLKVKLKVLTNRIYNQKQVLATFQLINQAKNPQFCTSADYAIIIFSLT